MAHNAGNPLDRSLAAGLRRAGFRKWYERELFSSHAHMVLAFLSVIGLIGSFEAFRMASPANRATNLALIILCIAIGLWSLRRYLFLLTRAEDVANQATCAGCGDYGRLRVAGQSANPGDTPVQCVRCDHRWIISTEDT